MLSHNDIDLSDSESDLDSDLSENLAADEIIDLDNEIEAKLEENNEIEAVKNEDNLSTENLLKIKKDFENSITCPISFCIFLEPVLLLPEMRFTVEKQVADSLVGKTYLTDIVITSYIINYSMRNQVDEYLRNNPSAKIHQYVNKILEEKQEEDPYRDLNQAGEGQLPNAAPNNIPVNNAVIARIRSWEEVLKDLDSHIDFHSEPRAAINSDQLVSDLVNLGQEQLNKVFRWKDNKKQTIFFMLSSTLIGRGLLNDYFHLRNAFTPDTINFHNGTNSALNNLAQFAECSALFADETFCLKISEQAFNRNGSTLEYFTPNYDTYRIWSTPCLTLGLTSAGKSILLNNAILSSKITEEGLNLTSEIELVTCIPEEAREDYGPLEVTRSLGTISLLQLLASIDVGLKVLASHPTLQSKINSENLNKLPSKNFEFSTFCRRIDSHSFQKNESVFYTLVSTTLGQQILFDNIELLSKVNSAALNAPVNKPNYECARSAASKLYETELGRKILMKDIPVPLIERISVAGLSVKYGNYDHSLILGSHYKIFGFHLLSSISQDEQLAGNIEFRNTLKLFVIKHYILQKTWSAGLFKSKPDSVETIFNQVKKVEDGKEKTSTGLAAVHEIAKTAASKKSFFRAVDTQEFLESILPQNERLLMQNFNRLKRY